MIRYVIYGKPVPLQRHRQFKNHAYDPQKAKKEEWRWQILAHRDHEPLTGPIILICRFVFQIPPAYSKARQRKLIAHPHTGKPDTSNLIKFVEDVGNDILFTDDALITSITASKQYGMTPYTEITLRSVYGHGSSRGGSH